VILAPAPWVPVRDRGPRSYGGSQSSGKKLVGHTFKYAVFDIKQRIITNFSSHRPNYTQQKICGNMGRGDQTSDFVEGGGPPDVIDRTAPVDPSSSMSAQCV